MMRDRDALGKGKKRDGEQENCDQDRNGYPAVINSLLLAADDSSVGAFVRL